MNEISWSTLISILIAFTLLMFGQDGLINGIPYIKNYRSELIIILGILVFFFIVVLMVVQLRDVGIEGAAVQILLAILVAGVISDFVTTFIGIGNIIGSKTSDGGVLWSVEVLVFSVVCSSLMFGLLIASPIVKSSYDLGGFPLWMLGVLFFSTAIFDIFTSFRGLAELFKLEKEYAISKEVLLWFFSILMFFCQFGVIYLLSENRRAFRA